MMVGVAKTLGTVVAVHVMVIASLQSSSLLRAVIVVNSTGTGRPGPE